MIDHNNIFKKKTSISIFRSLVDPSGIEKMYYDTSGIAKSNRYSMKIYLWNIWWMNEWKRLFTFNNKKSGAITVAPTLKIYLKQSGK